jgi:hypothetical protein
MSYVTIDRFCQEEADAKEDVRRELERTGRPLRSSAGPLSDDELLAKLRDFGLDVDRDGVERLCAGALSAEEVARPIVDKLERGDDMAADWAWISLLALWQRWWRDRACLETLDDKIQAGYALDPENNTHATAVTWLNAWSDVLRLCDATGISSIEEFDDRFPMTQSLFNWSQDLEMALENAGRDDGEMRQALIEFCKESLRRFPREDQLLTENRRRALGGAYFDAGMTEKAEELFRSWLDADPGWGWGWIGWADLYLPGAGGPGPGRETTAPRLLCPRCPGPGLHRGAAARGVRGQRSARRSQAVGRAGQATAARAGPPSRPAAAAARGHRANG